MHNWHPKEGTLSEKELSQAENIIQRSIQYYHFKQEIKILSMLKGNDSQFQDCRSARKKETALSYSTATFTSWTHSLIKKASLELVADSRV